MEYRVIRSDRKTLAIQLTAQGVVVRAPRRMSDRDIKRAVENHAAWISSRLAKRAAAEQALRDVPKLTPADVEDLRARAAAYIPARVAYYAGLMGVTCGRVTIRAQRARWGSCSAGGNLNFNCLLMLAPPETIDSVVVHELAHRKEMNHSARFYEEVLRVFPAYRLHNGWLKQNGAALLAKLP